MSKKIHQFVYRRPEIGEGGSMIKTFPSGNILEDIYVPVTQFGISAPAGFKFSFDGNDWITIGPYGIYELDLEGGLGQISALYLDQDFKVDPDEKVMILIDIVYGGVNK